MWSPEAALLAKLKLGLTTMSLESISLAPLKRSLTFFSLLRSVMTLYSELQEKQLHVNI